MQRTKKLAISGFKGWMLNNIMDFLFQTRQLNVGECLPSSCSSSDVRLLLVQERTQGATISIVGVRPVPGDYSIWQDGKFHVVW